MKQHLYKGCCYAAKEFLNEATPSTKHGAQWHVPESENFTVSNEDDQGIYGCGAVSSDVTTMSREVDAEGDETIHWTVVRKGDFSLIITGIVLEMGLVFP